MIIFTFCMSWLICSLETRVLRCGGKVKLVPWAGIKKCFSIPAIYKEAFFHEYAEILSPWQVGNCDLFFYSAEMVLQQESLLKSHSCAFLQLPWMHSSGDQRVSLRKNTDISISTSAWQLAKVLFLTEVLGTDLTLHFQLALCRLLSELSVLQLSFQVLEACLMLSSKSAEFRGGCGWLHHPRSTESCLLHELCLTVR